MSRRSVWRKILPDEIEMGVYVPRCSVCGRYHNKIDLFIHWFFKGYYCVACIQGRLYDDTRTIKELP